MHGVEPFAYLKDVVETLTVNPFADLEQLLPTNWRPRAERTMPQAAGVVKSAKAA